MDRAERPGESYDNKLSMCLGHGCSPSRLYTGHIVEGLRNARSDGEILNMCWSLVAAEEAAGAGQLTCKAEDLD